jgi:CxxC motif-containing protein (DUF1111 family)
MLAGMASAVVGTICLSGPLSAQVATDAATANVGVHDPGVRGGPAGAGGPLPGLNADELAFFAAASDVFQEIDSVAGNVAGEEGAGLGPRFNLNQCSGCHLQPAVGGSAPLPNPQPTVARLHGANNVIPSFITPTGPVREVRFVKNPDGTPDGGVHSLFVITGRSDAPPGCSIKQEDFQNQFNNGNAIFRIPTPTFGTGLVENTPDRNLEASLASMASLKSHLGISGEFNRSGNDGTITRFGWKAQNKSLLIFSGEAYNVEQGVTNENFPNEREDDPNCATNPTPEDHTHFTAGDPTEVSGDIISFAGFMRFLAAPTPAPATSTSTRGSQVFQSIGCQACHALSQTTARSPYTGQSNVTFQPLSDIAVHDMGLGLADNVSQGNANGREFRSAPLWGVGQRIFFLHDGRSNDLLDTIQQHSSRFSEANTVINSFNMLSPSDKQALLVYLRSL